MFPPEERPCTAHAEKPPSTNLRHRPTVALPNMTKKAIT